MSKPLRPSTLPPEARHDVRVLRWMGAGRCLVEDATGHTFTASGAIPGERVDVHPTHDGHQYRWRVTQVRSPHPERIAPACPHARACTGCNLLHVTEPVEEALKRQICSEVLERFAGLKWPMEHVEVIGTATRGDHRHRTALRLARVDGALRLGLAGHDHSLVHIPDCPALHPALRTQMEEVLQCAEVLLPDVQGPLVVEAIAGQEGVGVLIRAGTPTSQEEARHLAEALLSSSALAVAWEQEGDSEPHLLRGPWPRPRMAVAWAPPGHPRAWTQPTPDAARTLHAWVLEHLPPAGKRLLDATAGLGELTFRLAEAGADAITAVERHWPTARALQQAVERSGLPIEVRAGDIRTLARRFLERGQPPFDHVIVNPMRRSLGDATLMALAQLSRGSLLYLAPAPRAGAHDLARLIRSGWQVERVATAMLHPGTAATLMAVLLSPPFGP